MFEELIKKSHSDQEFYHALRESVSVQGRLISPSQLLRRAAALKPDTVALFFEEKSITYRDFFRRACALTRLVRSHVRPGDRVIISFENSLEFYISYFAVWQAGAVVIPLNTFLREREIRHIINDARPALIITHSDRVELFQAAGIDALPTILNEEHIPQSADESDELYASDISNIGPEELAVLLYTSGTTGDPKGVMLSGKNIITNVLQAIVAIKQVGEERFFAVLPLFHAFAQCACVWAPVFTCSTVIVVAKIDRRKILRALEYKPTVFLGVPALFGLLCLLKNVRLDSVTLFASGGDAMPDKIRMAFALLYRRKICSGYGMTESSPIISLDAEDDLEPTNATGKPVIGMEVSIRADDGNEVSRGIIGAIWVRGDNVMMGYYNAPDLTAQVIKHGWLNTGDLGYLNAHGRVVITGRLKDLIKHKGLNIYPQEIENVIAMHSNVIRVGVIGKPDDIDGEIPVAYVQIRVAQAGVDKELEELCKKQLALYKVPREFICSVEELPLTVTGKVDKKVLRKL